ncbi:hypothetical protein I4U23_023609 [Adineta vaga]|nr:hypothetical protein I4U23_023609 [Adineta vaga]
MSDPFILSLNYASTQIYIYMGIVLIISGVFGGLMNIIVFLSLEIYRQNSTAFYLIIVSIVNIGQLLTGLLSRVLISAFGFDWTESSLVFCKLRYTIFQACGIISPMCLCLVTIDQFLATSARLQWQRWSSIKVAHRSSSICIIFWLLYGIPYLIYYNPTLINSTKQTGCMITNSNYLKYYSSVHTPIIMGAIPIIITTVFGFLAYRNVKQFSHRAIPLVRRRHETQLTIMVFVQIIFNIFATTPVFVIRTLASQTTLTSDPKIGAQMQFAIALTTGIYYFYYAVPFYIYVCVSERFRNQLRYVIIDIHMNRCRRLKRNDVTPQTQVAPKSGGQQITVENIELVSKK